MKRGNTNDWRPLSRFLVAVCVPGILAGINDPRTAAAEPAASKISLRWVIPEGAMLALPGRDEKFQNANAVPTRFSLTADYRYRLKISNIPGSTRDLYPSITVYPLTKESKALFADTDLVVTLTEKDRDLVAEGNVLTKVVFIPGPQFTLRPIPGLGPSDSTNDYITLASHELDPGIDVLVQAARSGKVVLMMRIGMAASAKATVERLTK